MGEYFLFNNFKFQGILKATEDSIIYALPVEVFEQVLKDKALAKLTVTKELMSHFSLAKYLSEMQMMILINKIEMGTYEQGESIIEQVAKTY